jgi:hypothetical protein
MPFVTIRLGKKCHAMLGVGEAVGKWVLPYTAGKSAGGYNRSGGSPPFSSASQNASYRYTPAQRNDLSTGHCSIAHVKNTGDNLSSYQKRTVIK